MRRVDCVIPLKGRPNDRQQVAKASAIAASRHGLQRTHVIQRLEQPDVEVEFWPPPGDRAVLAEQRCRIPAELSERLSLESHAIEWPFRWSHVGDDAMPRQLR